MSKSRRLSRILPSIVAGVMLFGTPSMAQQSFPFQNESLSFEERVNDLVGRMTLEEKVQQMKDVAPAIPRLGVPEYNWWNEALHGVARSGLATVFPQAIGMAATWDKPLMFKLATVISDEGRAKYHQYLRENSHARYQGLTFWSPNINIFRDPRWGRGQETYGEDPYLTGTLGVQFIKGLQGDDPKYYKTVATVKHFAVHSGPEPERHVFDAVVSERDYRETYLPHFEMGIKEGKAYSLMCAYNRVDGKAACGSDPLLKDLLRNEWKFNGFIVSDCGAIDDIYLRHKVEPTAAAAAARGVKSGTDLDCGRVYPNLAQAVKEGLISEAEIDVSLKRLFLARMRLGMFDSPEKVKWAQIPFSVLDQRANRDVAVQVARESMVLLKNQGNVLPLKKSIKTLAVIGPNSDQAQMLLGNYNGTPKDPITPLRGLREKLPNAKVLYARGSDLAEGFPVLDKAPSSVLRTPDGKPGLMVEYFSTATLEGSPVASGVDSTVDADWKAGSPRPGLNADDFGVRWTGTFRPPQTGSYRLALNGTLKFELYLNDSLVTQSFYPSRNGETPDPRLMQTQPMQLEGGKDYSIRIIGHETYGEAQLQLQWSTPSETLAAEAEAIAKQADAVVMFLGLTARLEGEEMRVQIPGFRGGDRTSIDLPATQENLLKRIVALKKPTVLVLLNGSALAVNYAHENVPAILEAWYPGQAAGTAIADVLFGDYNPAGRLPVTFYKSVNDLPPFEDYAMKNRTYRFFTGQPLYAFGHGLSYTTFGYKNLRTSANQISGSDTITVSVDVTNTGKIAGDEVVQLYVGYPGSKIERAIKDLRGYERVSLTPGETKTITFSLPGSSLAYWNTEKHAWAIDAGKANLQIGASSADIRLTKAIDMK